MPTQIKNVEGFVKLWETPYWDNVNLGISQAGRDHCTAGLKLDKIKLVKIVPRYLPNYATRPLPLPTKLVNIFWTGNQTTMGTKIV